MTDAAVRLADYDFALPPARIAQAPASPRDSSRLMAVPRRAGAANRHLRFVDVVGLLRPADLLVVNRTRVMPARLRVRRRSGGRGELLLHRPLDGPHAQACVWEGLGRPGSALRLGAELLAADGTVLTVRARAGATVTVAAERPIWPLLEACGEVPLPPYIVRPAAGDAPGHASGGPGGPGGAIRHDDGADYQTMFAREPGAVAAPTASLHFTPALVARLAAAGVALREIVLHVGPGTFLPVRDEHADDARQHPMHAEAYAVPPDTVAAIAGARRAGGRVVAVGTTSLRALEAWHASGAAQGEARSLIYPGYRFGCVDGLITNFHLPRSTLMLLVAALVGRERLLAAYAEALARPYRFYSYGDAMAIL